MRLKSSWSNTATLWVIIVVAVIEALQQALKQSPDVTALLPRWTTSPNLNYLPLLLLTLAGVFWLLDHRPGRHLDGALSAAASPQSGPDTHPPANPEPPASPRVIKQAPNIVSARAEAEWIPDPLDADPDRHAQALLAVFHNDATVGIAQNVTASIIYEFGKIGFFDLARVIRAVWVTDQGSFANHVDFQANSVRRLILAVQRPRPVRFFALENLSDDMTDDARKISAAIRRVPLELSVALEGLRFKARVRLRIDGQVSAEEYCFFLHLNDDPATCSKEEDEIPF